VAGSSVRGTKNTDGAITINTAYPAENLHGAGVRRDKGVVWLTLFGITVLSLALNLAGHGFPLGYHIDEGGKVLQILTGQESFAQPTFMIDVNRVVHLFTRQVAFQQVVETGRAVTALFGAVIVLACFLLFRPVGGTRAALLASLAVAVSPIMVVHAHYLKEDTYFAFAVMLALAAYLALLRSVTGRRILMLGLASGLAIATKYAGALLFLFYAMAPFVIGVADRQSYARAIAGALAIAFAVFLVVDFHLFGNTAQFLDRFWFQVVHAATGHAEQVLLKITALDYWFTFHLLYSIVPGIGLVMAGAVALAIALCALGVLQLSREERVLAGFAGFFYLAIELSPSKPFPDFMRYAMPIIPVLLYLAVRGLLVAGRTISLGGAWAGPSLCLAVIAATGYDTSMLVVYLNDDTRLALARALPTLNGPVLVEQYAAPGSRLFTVSRYTLASLRASGVRYVAVSSFTYDRYEVAGRLSGQEPETYLRRQRYADLFACGYRAFHPSYRSFAFSNPEIRLIDLSGCR